MTAADYTTTATYKAFAGISDTDRDVVIAATITRASRALDRFLHLEDGGCVSQTFTKYFDGTGGRLWVPPLLSVTTFKTDTDGDATFEYTWSVTGGYRDYILYPLNGPPYNEIQVDKINGRYTLPVGQNCIEIAGSWGLAATLPGPIEEACLLLTARYLNRAKTPEGIAGGGEAGLIRLEQVDPDVAALLARAGYSQAGVIH